MFQFPKKHHFFPLFFSNILSDTKQERSLKKFPEDTCAGSGIWDALLRVIVSDSCLRGGTRRLDPRVKLSARHSIPISCLTCSLDLMGSDRKKKVSWTWTFSGPCFQTWNSAALWTRVTCARPWVGSSWVTSDWRVPRPITKSPSLKAKASVTTHDETTSLWLQEHWDRWQACKIYYN